MPDQDLNQAASRERAAETRATRNAALACAAVILLIYVVNSLSVGTEYERADVAIDAAFPWLLEGTAVIAMLIALPLALWAGRVFPLDPGRWRASALAHLPILLVFVTVQIGLMYGLRHIVWPLAFDRSWSSDDGTLNIFIYEGRKQAAAYLGFQAAIWTTRTIEFLRLEAEAARTEARDTRRVTLKCGGRVMRLPAGEFRAAKAAGNYVEARFGEGRHLARLTLTELEALLREAGVDAVRVHRSWLVNREQVKEIAPTGEGDVTITLADGESVPGSRRYRDRLAA